MYLNIYYIIVIKRYCPVGGTFLDWYRSSRAEAFSSVLGSVLPRQSWDEHPPDEGLDAVDGGGTHGQGPPATR